MICLFLQFLLILTNSSIFLILSISVLIHKFFLSPNDCLIQVKVLCFSFPISWLAFFLNIYSHFFVVFIYYACYILFILKCLLFSSFRNCKRQAIGCLIRFLSSRMPSSVDRMKCIFSQIGPFLEWSSCP